MEQTIYYKITNAEENHNGFQYVDGLNVLKEEFNDDPKMSCCPGGLYFTDIRNIFEFLDYGIHVREITLPSDKPDFKMIQDENKWRANMIILGKRYNLCDVDTFKYLVEKGADIHFDDDHILRWSAEKGYLNIVKYLIEKGVDIHVNNDCALRSSARCGHLDVVKFLLTKGADIHANDESALTHSAHNGHLEIVKYLVENGRGIGTECSFPDLPEYRRDDISGQGANIHENDDYALRLSVESNHLEIVKFLIEKGADVHVRNDCILKCAAEYNYTDIHNSLLDHIKKNPKN